MTPVKEEEKEKEKRTYKCDWLCGKAADRTVVITGASFIVKDVDVRLCKDCQLLLQSYAGMQYEWKEL